MRTSVILALAAACAMAACERKSSLYLEPGRAAPAKAPAAAPPPPADVQKASTPAPEASAPNLQKASAPAPPKG